MLHSKLLCHEFFFDSFFFFCHRSKTGTHGKPEIRLDIDILQSIAMTLHHSRKFMSYFLCLYPSSFYNSLLLINFII